MKYRDHRGSYRASMDTTREIAPSLEALAVILKVPVSAIKVEPYGGIDRRNGWNTHVVTVDGHPVGFTDGKAT